ncbi:hypothetical protein EKO04_007807 [Ascochyta lentis]|uniref:Uncharacterized protein n=1 Tax=Ascochyta lentis TaxID=205686 RepID=A0A8H7J0N8_9PLEO|nr:hypothetical protein EKO04_007807 [Ascochyta lentis]
MHSNPEPHPSHRRRTSTSPDDVCPRTTEEAERSPPATTTQPRPTETFDFNLTELGAQFASLNYQYKQWMNEYLNEPTLDDHFFVT